MSALIQGQIHTTEHFKEHMDWFVLHSKELDEHSAKSGQSP